MINPFRRAALAVLGVLAVVSLAACASTTKPLETGSATPTSSQPSASTPKEAPTKNTDPKPGDFRIAIKITKKECFGEAGCNITYHIKPTYVGALPLGDGAYQVTYRVVGGDSGPVINTFTVDNGTVSFQEEEFVSTRSAAVKLRAVATEVESA